MAILIAKAGGGPAQMRFQNLTDVHTRWHTDRVEDDVDGTAIGQEGHVLDRQDARDDTFVAVTSGHLVARANLALLGDQDAHHLVDTDRQIGQVVARKGFDVDDFATHTMGYAQRGIFDLTGLFTEDRAEQALLSRQVGLALGCNLADQNVVRIDLGTNVNDALDR